MVKDRRESGGGGGGGEWKGRGRGEGWCMTNLNSARQG